MFTNVQKDRKQHWNNMYSMFSQNEGYHGLEEAFSFSMVVRLNQKHHIS